MWAYIKARNLPYNALHDRGYPSIGCAPCTRAVEPGADPRSGRWWWENPDSRECGLQPRRRVIPLKVEPRRAAAAAHLTTAPWTTSPFFCVSPASPCSSSAAAKSPHARSICCCEPPRRSGRCTRACPRPRGASSSGRDRARRRPSSSPSIWTACGSAIAATDKHAVNAWVARQAERRNIPVNVVDDRELSRFIVPAIVDRSPVVVAVGSSGDAPVLTRRLRERLESFLPQRLGALAQLAGKLRPTIKARIESPARAPPLLGELLRRHDRGRRARRARGRCGSGDRPAHRRFVRADRERGAEHAGEVALVGAGPGDPGLLTLRALRALQNADVILYDRLVSAGGSRSRASRRRAHLRRQGSRRRAGFAGRDQRAARAARAAGQARVPAQGRRSFHLRSRRRGARSARGCRCSLRSRAGRHRCRRLRGVRRHSADASRSRAVADVRHRPLQGRDGDSVDWEQLARPAQTVVFYMGLGHLEQHRCAAARARCARVARGAIDRAGHARRRSAS